MQWPRPPTLDGERWFKVTLAQLLRGPHEATEAWVRTVTELVPYHPAGRLPERKIAAPAAVSLPAAALPGERALLQRLAELPDPASRLAWLYDEDPEAIAARTLDPAELGARYDWTAFGPGASWEQIRAWGAGDETFLSAIRRMVPDRFVLFSGRSDTLAAPSILDAMAALLPDAVRVTWGAEDLAAPVLSVCPAPEHRAILVAEEAAVTELLRMLVEHADVRDRVSAVLSVGGVIGGRTDEEERYSEATCRDWLEAHFTQGDLDTEIVRLTPYLAVQWLHRSAWPPGAPGLPLPSARFPEPILDVPVETIESVDLGPIPADRPLPVEIVAKALIAVVIGYVRSRR